MKILIAVMFLCIAAQAHAADLAALPISNWSIRYSSADVAQRDPERADGYNAPYPLLADPAVCNETQARENDSACGSANTSPGWYFDFPGFSSDGHVNYILANAKIVAGDSTITMRVRITSNVSRVMFQGSGLDYCLLPV